MSLLQYGDIIQQIVQPTIIDNVVNPNMDKLYSIGQKNTNVKGGASISEENIVTNTFNGGAFTRADANPDSMVQAFANPTWTKKYYHETATIRREDLSEAKEGTPLVNMLSDGATKAAAGCMSHVFTGAMTQLAADIDSAAAYSDAAIARATIGASHEDNSDTALSLALLRAAQKATELKRQTDWSTYVWLLQGNCYNVAVPLMNATGSWNTSTPAGQVMNVDTGYAQVNRFDTIEVQTMYGMTTGDCYLFPKQNLQIQEHFPMTIEIVQSADQFAFDITARIGVNIWVRQPKFAAKLTLKD